MLKLAVDARFWNRNELSTIFFTLLSDLLCELHCSTDRVHASNSRRLHQLTDMFYGRAAHIFQNS